MKRTILCFLTVTTVLLLCGCAVQPPTATTLPTVSATTAPEPALGNGRFVYLKSTKNVVYENVANLELGELFMRSCLKRALDAFEDEPTAIFVVHVWDTTMATPEEVYEKFIKPLGVYETYLTDSHIYITREQLEQIQPHEDFSIVLSLAYKTDNREIKIRRTGILWVITQEALQDLLDSIPEEPIFISVDISYGILDESAAETTQEQFMNASNGILQDYASVLMDVGREDSSSIIHAAVSKETILKLFVDERVDTITISGWGGEFYTTEKIE